MIHFMQYGMTACMKKGPPGDWDDTHRWSGDWKVVNCPDCLEGLNNATAPTYEVSPDGKSIKCLRCGMVSYHPTDVELHYCGKCHACHDDIWPPARHWWVTHPDPEPPERRRLPLPRPE